MNEKQKIAASAKIEKQFDLARKQYWPEVEDVDIWNRKNSKGFATLPRAMPQIMAIIDAISPKGKPASSTYLALWFRSYDLQMQVQIRTPAYFAAESGFGGERAITTWQGRMQQLLNFGFIKVEKGRTGPYENVLILNPYNVIYRLHENGELSSPHLSELYNETVMRANEVGAKDFEIFAKRMKEQVIKEKG